MAAFDMQFAPGQQCFIATEGSDPMCSQDVDEFTIIVNDPPLPPDGGYIISNGQCGKAVASGN